MATLWATLRENTRDIFGLQRAATIAQSAVTLPTRRPTFGATADQAMTLAPAYRAMQVLTTAASQLALAQFRGDNKIDSSAILAAPDLTTHRSAFIEYTVASMAVDGNAFWRLIRSTVDNTVVDIRPLNPAEVSVNRNARTDALTYSYRGADYGPEQIRHLQLMRLPGRDRGLGPIEAGKAELQGALEARDYGASWFSQGTVPEGVLSSDQPLSSDQAKLYKQTWQGIDPATGEQNPNGHDLRVLGAGLRYEYLALKPADAQYLETQQFTTTQIARLFGVPASLMLAAVDGSSQTYANIEQDWIGFTRFTLMRYLREIEEAFSAILPRGNTARFNVDSLLRTDTKTRYEAHKIALDARFMTRADVRLLEGLPFIPGTELFDPPASSPAPASIGPAA